MAESKPLIGAGIMAESKPLIGADLTTILEFAGDVDSVELKLTVPESAQRTTAAAPQLDAIDAQIRQVFFFDTPDLDLRATRDFVVEVDAMPGGYVCSSVLQVQVDAGVPGRARSASAAQAVHEGAARLLRQ